MYNCKHEVQFNRQTLYTPIHRSNSYALALPPKITLTSMRWYIPKIIPNDNVKSLLLTQIKEKINVDMAFMNKKMDHADLTPSQITSTFSYQINYSAGVEKPRYIIAGFQSVDTANPYYADQTNINYAIFNGVNLNGQNTWMVDVNYVNLKINGTQYQLMDYQNNFNNNAIARWYNEYKKFKNSYTGDFDEEDMVNLYSFRNLYRLYVFDISKQTEALLTTGIGNVTLDFYFNPSPAGNPPATLKTELFILSLFDRVLKLGSDGTKQTIIT